MLKVFTVMIISNMHACMLVQRGEEFFLSMQAVEIEDKAAIGKQ